MQGYISHKESSYLLSI